MFLVRKQAEGKKLAMPRQTSAQANADAPAHPGTLVRRLALEPKQLTVTAAAKLLGVGRPALSNFLNGRTSATKEMAVKIEQAFGLSAHKILTMQSEYDGHQASANASAGDTLPYVAPYLEFKSTDVEAWVERNIPTRVRLPVLLRTLAHSTDPALNKIDFPGNNDGERPGWDGWIETGKGNAWVPKGVSGWEIGTDVNVAKKAEGDYRSRTDSVAPDKRAGITFVFVSPRHWPGKAQWVKSKQALGEWKDVRAYDSCDLEQWLQQSHAGQIWFANETGNPVAGVRTLAQCWSHWSEVSVPTLSGKLFAPAVETARLLFKTRLSSAPGAPTIVAADSSEEALAFLAQLFLPVSSDDEIDDLGRYYDRVLIFDQPGIIEKLALGAKQFIAVATNREVEKELGRFARDIHTIAVYPRNATSADIDITLKPLSYMAFREGLEDMGLDRDDIHKLERESGRSPTVLRRRLSSVPAIRTPQWAADEGVSAELVPFLLVGAWSSANTTDQTLLTLLADKDGYDELDKACHRLARLDDAPVWAVGTYRGVVSKVDLLFAIAGSVGLDDLRKYFDLAKIVLGEDDPKLDLPEERRWFSGMGEKTREFSSVMRQGVAETLVLLAVHGNSLFQSRLGIDCEFEAEKLVRETLDPLTTRKLEANDRDLPVYAEAAPLTFLKILEEDLKADHPETYGLLRPAESSLFGGCPRTGLIWALEVLAWNPEHLPRVSMILAQLSEIEIEDNWVNKPINTLQSIFRVWMPQTAASHEERLDVIRGIKEKYPEVAWWICIEQTHTGHGSGDYNERPKWRTDAQGFGEPLKTRGPVIQFMHDLVEIMFQWEHHTPSMLGDLVKRLPDLRILGQDSQDRVWQLVDAWLATKPSDRDKADLREIIRRNVLSRMGKRRTNPDEYAVLSKLAKSVCGKLEPSDVLYRNEWLFRTSWVEDSADELIEEDPDFRARERHIQELRVSALSAILDERGLAGIVDLAGMGDCAFEIGRLMTNNILDSQVHSEFVVEVLGSCNGDHDALELRCKQLLNGAMFGIHHRDESVTTFDGIKSALSPEQFCVVLMLSPFRKATWQFVDNLPSGLQEKYWINVQPHWIHDADDENNEAVERLLKAKRPRAAFACVHYKLDQLNPELLFRMMSDVVTEDVDPQEHYQLEEYYIDKAFRFIDASSEITLEQKAGLELAYMDALARPWNDKAFGLPNLEKYIEANPEFFAQAVVWTYKRSDDGKDPDGWAVPEEQILLRAKRGYKLLEGLRRFPGQGRPQREEQQKLLSWVRTVRELCEQLKRRDMGDQCIGKLLAHSPLGEDGIWPCESVRHVMEEAHSEQMMRGAHTSLYNSRGVVTRAEGGAQERELAEKYRKWAVELRTSHPFVSSELLMGMMRTYEHEARGYDLEADIRRRLP